MLQPLSWVAVGVLRAAANNQPCTRFSLEWPQFEDTFRKGICSYAANFSRNLEESPRESKSPSFQVLAQPYTT